MVYTLQPYVHRSISMQGDGTKNNKLWNYMDLAWSVVNDTTVQIIEMTTCVYWPVAGWSGNRHLIVNRIRKCSWYIPPRKET